MRKPLISSLTKQAHLWFFSFMGFVAVLYLTFPHRIGLTSDSITYIGTARSLSAHYSFTELNGSPLSDFPFFYPFFLSLILNITRVDPVLFAPIVNALLFTAVIISSAYIVQQIIPQSRIHQLLVTGIIATSPVLWHVYVMLWSETLFLLEILWFLIFIKKFLTTTSFKVLITVSVITAIACITRYAGMYLIGTGILLLLAQQNIPWKKRFQYTLIFTAISSSLLLINLVHNILASGTATGEREKGITTLHQNIVYYGTVLNGWLWHINSTVVSAVTGYSFLIFFTLALLAVYRNIKRVSSYSLLAATLFTSYSFFIVLVSTVSHFEQIDSRLVVPAFIPLVLSCARPAYIFSKRKKGKLIVLILFAVILVVQIIKDIRPFPELDLNNPHYYLSTQWQHSPVLQYAQQHRNEIPPYCTLYSNATELTYFFAGLHCDRVPQKTNTKEIAGFLEEDNVCIIWLYKANIPDEISLQYILKNKKLKLVKLLPDGAIYFSEEN